MKEYYIVFNTEENEIEGVFDTLDKALDECEKVIIDYAYITDYSMPWCDEHGETWSLSKEKQFIKNHFKAYLREALKDGYELMGCEIRKCEINKAYDPEKGMPLVNFEEEIK